ncbi:two-component system OmpR family sensor kinase [Agromyces terreus]|uniref:histidine kinase n=1 Tax=Agromyces terreus TaxID=424795 RepID=A0A9X2GYS4_9MICO|nr:HAMP domain-containing sensor histidine kinase [Agromyces terreus]MCP2369823.1 two-component system OmpR family sensor kinase [Agromyces terreus]
MTRPGDPGHAAAARVAAVHTGADAVVEEPPGSSTARRGLPWTLHRRLLVIVAALLVAVSATVGVVTVAVFHSASMERLDGNLDEAISRTNLGPALPGDPAEAPGIALSVPGQQAGTLAALVQADGTANAGYITERGRVLELPADVAEPLTTVPADGGSHTISIGDLGEYRAKAVERPEWNGITVVLALPLADVTTATTQLALTISIVAVIGLVLALIVGSAVVRRALRPLAAVTETAQHVSELPLERGDVALAERVPVDDERTEVGRLAAAFNRMLGHVASALTAREHSERKVRRFVADASHELRTPLASIRGYAELTRLHGGDLPPDVTHAISRIESESVRMTELVEDLLLLARLDEGRELQTLPVDLERMLGEAVGDAQAAGPGHDWEVRATDAATEVVGDEPRLRQVVTNLLANARVHTPEGTRVVASLAREGDEIVLRVADDGPGIPPELLGSLFERFARGDSSRSRRAGSTGLGLAIVRAVVEAHHGTVDVASEPGSTVFTVRLPAERPPAERLAAERLTAER